MCPNVERPLAVDLDGTLVRSDLLVDGASAYATRTPFGLLRIACWAAAGRDRVKVELANRVEVEPASLPYRTDMLDWLRSEHRTGRRLLLVSASDERQVQAVAEHLGIFEDYVGTHLGRNLKARIKRDVLVERFGSGGYDYIGDHLDDLTVWADAHTAHVVGGSPLASRVAQTSSVGSIFPPSRSGAALLLLKAMRPHQWIKNALVAVPLLSAQMVGDTTAVVQTALAIALFCLVASSVYLLNDIVDMPNDRTHPEKQGRPLASGRLNPLVSWFAWPALVVTSFGLSLALLPWEFAAVLATYFGLTLAYSFWAKQRGVLDVVVLGGLYTIRLVAGAAAISVPLSMWLVTFSMLFFLSLALIKRVSELTRLRRTGETIRGRGYYDTDLELLSSYGVASSIGSVVIFAVYLQDLRTQQMYASPAILGLAIPILLAWLMRCWLWAHRGDMNEDPIVFAASDRKSQLLGIAFVAVFVVANLLHT